jgi:leucyl/phenylalanyl-tRNA--protein transferase
VKATVPPLLDATLTFPDPRQADQRGLVALGGDLSVARLRLAYRTGVFPWTVNPISWWSPDPRGIIELADFKPSRRLGQILRQNRFEVTFNCAFRDVITACSTPAPGRERSWITDEFIAAYTALHEAGDAHSVECWRGGELVGGVYGVSAGGLFAGESMFHRANNASKVAVAHLVSRLRQQGFVLLDVQVVTPATASLGAVEIPRDEYLRRLALAVRQEARFECPSEG